MGNLLMHFKIPSRCVVRVAIRVNVGIASEYVGMDFYNIM